jgi:SpoVK/Ycf46/Vps4 family AAA+-type ATPase
MLNKRKKAFDPLKTYNYNKFLTIMDNLNVSKKKTEIEATIINIEQHKINKLIENSNNDFSLNNMSHSSFIGQQPISSEQNDPNKYIDFNNLKIPTQTSNQIPIPLSNQIPILKKIININVEINNIEDILHLINTYEINADIQYNIDMKALHNIKEPLEELHNMIGMKDLKSNIVDQILYFIQQLHKNKNLSGDFLHTVIYGPPGTGKTEIAKIMGKIYSKIGILSKGTFKKVTRSDLIAGYLGQTSLKTMEVIKDSLGGVLFIDEAYALGNPEKRDSFAKECIDTLCEALSNNKENLMVIIAGYEKELKESFFAFNQGLDSRFTWRFKTDKYIAEDLHQIFIKMVEDIGWKIDIETKITTDWFKKNEDYFQFFGRDIETLLAKTKIAHSRRVFCLSEKDKRKISLKDLDKGLEIFLRNDDIKNKKEEKELKRYMYNTLYS